MTTKVTIIGEGSVIAKKYSKIKFISVLTGYGIMEPIKSSRDWPDPCNWDNIELICREYTTYSNKPGKDLMFAYDSNRTAGVMYLGYFNEGIV
jgi:hypothetical protein